MLTRLICMWKGHKFGKPRERRQDENVEGTTRVKVCRRCSHVARVKPRTRKEKT